MSQEDTYFLEFRLMSKPIKKWITIAPNMLQVMSGGKAEMHMNKQIHEKIELYHL